ncbi:MAG: T9SS C-terminal target domain-containing protein [Sphingobacteriales bacterium]|nr:MAG: T9SS C-terminal target domain-containing protein [Sphingobacteriales bacterium]TAF82546.1 MAG: T9SS C-terminal target domain-containing protein [Sphingobacteriales bacterium]
MKQKLLFKTAILIAMVALGNNSFAQYGNAIAGGKPIDGGGGGGGVIIGPEIPKSTAPTITNSPVTNVTSSGATINFTVNPGNAATTVKVYYGTSALSSSVVSPTGYNSTISSNGSINLTNLTAGTTYQFRVEAANSISTVLSPIATFTTLSAGTLAPTPIYHFNFNGSLTATDGVTSFISNNGITQYASNNSSLLFYQPNISNPSSVFSSTLANIPVGNASRSIVMRINFSELISQNYVFSYGSVITNQAYGWTQQNPNTKNFFWGANDALFANNLSINTWYTMVFVYDGTIAYVYNNGTLLWSGAKTLNTVGTTFYLGGVLGGSQRGLNASIDDLQIFNTALTQAQITALNTTLPLNLTSLTAKAIVTGNQINWTSASSVNVKNIIIERSGADNTFAPLATLPATATQYIDTNPLAGDNYYRITSTDNDGSTTTYEKIAMVKGLAQEISFYPNPITNGILNVVAGADALKSASIINLNGIKVASAQAINNPKALVINTNALAKGVYILQVVGEKNSIAKKIIIN